MERKCEVWNKKKLGKGTILLSSKALNLNIKKEKIVIPYESIFNFDDSLTTTEDSSILYGLSFLIKYKKNDEEKKLTIYITSKDEDEKSFADFIQTIKRKLTKTKSKKMDSSKYLGIYTSGSKFIRAAFLFFIFGFPSIMILVSIIGYLEDPTRLSGIPWWVFIIIEIILVIYYFSYTGKKIVLKPEYIKVTGLLRERIVPFDKIKKFIRIEWPYKRKILYGDLYYGPKYEIIYSYKNKEEKVNFYYGQTNNISKLLKYLKHKLKHVPQRVIDRGKEKDWPVNQTY